MNQEHHLPQFMLILIDKDIIEDIDVFALDAVQAIRGEVDWLVHQISILIKRKRASLLEKRPGAVYGNDPTVIYICMIRRIDLTLRRGSKKDEVFALWAKFNDALNNAVARADQRIMTINSCNSTAHFTHLGELSDKGKEVLWSEIDHLLEKFDRNDIKLLPNPDLSRRKLPTPPM